MIEQTESPPASRRLRALLSDPRARPAMVPAVVVVIGAAIALLLRDRLSSSNEVAWAWGTHLATLGLLPPGILLLALAWRTFRVHGAHGAFVRASAWIGVPVEPAGPAGPRIGAAAELGLLAGIGVIVAASFGSDVRMPSNGSPLGPVWEAVGLGAALALGASTTLLAAAAWRWLPRRGLAAALLRAADWFPVRPSPPAPTAERASIGALASTRVVQGVAALTVLGLAMRVALLDQGLWYDEAVTSKIALLDFGEMVRTLPSESTPPLFYGLLWGWTRILGTSDAALRLLPALFGIATVPVAYAAAAELTNRRIGLVTAALTAVNPLMVWYSVEVRNYSLFLLLSALSVLFFARAMRRPGGGAPAWWAVVSSLGFAAHYFTVFLVLPQALWLLFARRGRSSVLAVAACGLFGLALLPLALLQSGDNSWISEIAFGERLGEVAPEFLAGYAPPLGGLLVGAVVGLVLVNAVLLALHGSGSQAPGVRIAGLLGAGTLGLPLLLPLAGFDFFITKNLMAAWLPLAIVVAAAVCVPRARSVAIASTAGLMAVGLGVFAAGLVDPTRLRNDTEAMATALGPPRADRAVLIAGDSQVLTWYVPGAVLQGVEGPPLRVAEIAVVATAAAPQGMHQGSTPALGDLARGRIPQGFSLVEQRAERDFVLKRFRSGAPRAVDRRELAAAAGSPGGPGLLFERVGGADNRGR